MPVTLENELYSELLEQLGDDIRDMERQKEEIKILEEEIKILEESGSKGTASSRASATCLTQINARLKAYIEGLIIGKGFPTQKGLDDALTGTESNFGRYYRYY